MNCFGILFESKIAVEVNTTFIVHIRPKISTEKRMNDP